MADTVGPAPAPEDVRAATGTGAEADRDRAWDGHRLNIRVSFWTPWGRVYLVQLGGPERRAPSRRLEERKRHPLFTVHNLLVMFACAMTLIGAAVFGSAVGMYFADVFLAS
jgi:hypothetical protein